jgi:DNA-binding transcriptional LysR family regulator
VRFMYSGLARTPDSQVMEEMDFAHQSLIEASASPSGRLRVTASVSFGEIVIAPRLKEFRTRYPNIELELILSDGRLDIINDQIDVAVRHGGLPDSSLIARKLSDVVYRLVSSPAYIEQSGMLQHPEDLQQHELVTFAYEDFRHVWTFVSGRASQTIPIRPALTVTNAAAIRQCVRDGAGIALLADWTVEQDLRSGRLIELLPEWRVSGASPDAAVWLVYPSSRFVPAKTKAFTAFLLGGGAQVNYEPKRIEKASD